MSKFLNISIDNTLGGTSANDALVSSQKATKEYADTKIGTFDTMPEPDISFVDNRVYQYTGTTTVTSPIYVHGKFYECKEVIPSTTPASYEWEEVALGGKATYDPVNERLVWA